MKVCWLSFEAAKDNHGRWCRGTGFASEKLNLLLGICESENGRCLRADLDLAAKIDDRIASRIREPGNLYIEMTTEDYGMRRKG